MIRPARPEDLPGIKRLWMQAFHDSEAATDFYFEHRMPLADLLDCLLIDTRDGELRGMLSLLPIDLISGGVGYPARYFFAIATDERFRRMGISTALIGEAERITMERGGVASLLVPANPPLFDFYGKRGYETMFSYEPAIFEGAGIADCPGGARLLPAEPEDILRLRDAAFSKSRLYVRWDEEALGFVIKASRAWDAPLLRFTLDGGEGYAYCERDGSAVIIKELALSGIGVPDAMRIVHRELHADSYHVRLAGDDAAAETRPYGMIRWLKKPLTLSPEGPAPYLGLGKD